MSTDNIELALAAITLANELKSSISGAQSGTSSQREFDADILIFSQFLDILVRLRLGRIKGITTCLESLLKAVSTASEEQSTEASGTRMRLRWLSRPHLVIFSSLLSGVCHLADNWQESDRFFADGLKAVLSELQLRSAGDCRHSTHEERILLLGLKYFMLLNQAQLSLMRADATTAQQKLIECDQIIKRYDCVKAFSYLKEIAVASLDQLVGNSGSALEKFHHLLSTGELPKCSRLLCLLSTYQIRSDAFGQYGDMVSDCLVLRCALNRDASIQLLDLKDEILKLDQGSTSFAIALQTLEGATAYRAKEFQRTK